MGTTLLKPITNGEKSLTDKAAEQITQLIINDKYRAGSKLPNEYELATRLGVGRSTVREAIKSLVSRNVLEVRHGSGTFVSERVGEVDDPLGFRFRRDRGLLAIELCEIRMMIEPPIAAMAAENASATEVETLQGLCAEVARLYESGVEHMEKDVEFHVQIARASGNSVAPRLIQIVSTAIPIITEITEKKLMRETLLNHQKVVDAIRLHNSSRAQKAMQAHIAFNKKGIALMYTAR